MIYYARIWILKGKVATINTNTNPIKFDVVEIEGADVYDLSIKGEYQDAADLRTVMTFDGEIFAGAEVIEATKRL